MTEISSQHILPETDSPFVPGTLTECAPIGRGLLDGLTFAVKDLIDVAGTRTGRGNPDYAALAPPATRSAVCVDQLLGAGARLRGKTVTDEFAFSLEGVNTHYGTPLNPRCPDRMPGGSSSGSASAVAAKQVDFALGTDTGGSVRVPAAFCGVYGLRPTHGVIAMDGVMPFAPSYDCVGLLAQDIDVLRDTLKVLTLHDVSDHDDKISPLELYCLDDAFALAEPELAQTLRTIAAEFADSPGLTVFDEQPQEWLTAYTTLQGHEIQTIHAQDIDVHQYRFAEDIAARFDSCRYIEQDAVFHYQQLRERFCQKLFDLLPEGKALVIPTTPCLPLLKQSHQAQIQAFYQSALALNSIAGHAGLPQVTFPVGSLNGCPLGLSLVGGRGADMRLLTTVSMLLDCFELDRHIV